MFDRLARLLVPISILVVHCACSIPKIVDKNTMMSMAPQMMSMDTIGLSCATGAALTPVVGALGKEGNRAYQAITLSAMAGGMCADLEVWNTEILRLRAIHDARAGDATDLLELEKRQHETAARRYAMAWDALDQAFSEVDLGEGCPDLREDRNEDLVYVLGLSSGLLAVLHDRPTGGTVGVSTGIPLQVERAAQCVDDDAFWGVPSALRAAVWASVPGATPEGADPLEVLEQAAAKGDAAGVRLARAFQVQTLSTLGMEPELRTALEAHAASLRQTPADPNWQLLDRFATLLIRHESDKRWASEKGHRTPSSDFGKLPLVLDEAQEEAFDGLLDMIMRLPEATPSDESDDPAPDPDDVADEPTEPE